MIARKGISPLSNEEKSYIRSLQSNPPVHHDGRGLEDYVPIPPETGVVPLANGSAEVCIGHPGQGGYVHEAGGVGSGTDVVVGVKLEAAGAEDEEEGGRKTCMYRFLVCHFYPFSIDAFDIGFCRSLAAPLQRTPYCPRTHWTTSNRI